MPYITTIKTPNIDATHCPHCGSEEIESIGEVGSKGIIQETVTCIDCGAHWIDISIVVERIIIKEISKADQ